MEWISVKDRLPTEFNKYGHSETVLVFESDEIRFGHYFSHGTWTVVGRLGCIKVTHWMPLPEPPKES